MNVNRDQISLDLFTVMKEAAWALHLANEAMSDLWQDVARPYSNGVTCEHIQDVIDAVAEVDTKARKLTIYMPVNREPVDLDTRMPF